MKISKRIRIIREHFDTSRMVRWLLLLSMTAAFILMLHPNLVITNSSYKLGDIAKRNIKAPRDFFIENREATQVRRQHAIESVRTVYDYDSSLAHQLVHKISRAFADVNAVIGAYRQKGAPATPDYAAGTQPSRRSLHDDIWQMKETFEAAIGIFISDGAYKILEDEDFSPKTARSIQKILTAIMGHGVVNNKEVLLKESSRGIVLRNVETQTENVVTDLGRFYGLDKARAMVRITGAPLLNSMDYNLRNLVVDFTQALFQPNITLNRNETEARRKKASAEVAPVMTRIKAGEMLLREGQKVGLLQLTELEALKNQIQEDQLVFNSLGAAVLILILLIIVYTLYCCQNSTPGHAHNKDLLFNICVMLTFLFLTSISVSFSRTLTGSASFPLPASSIVYGFPIAAGAMTVCLFQGIETAVPFALVISICATLLFQNRFALFIYFLLNSSMAAYWVHNSRERKVFITAGLKLGLLNMLLVTALNVYSSSGGFKILWDWGFAFMGGIIAGITTAGLAPLAEIAFGYRMDITLLELANLDQPILRRLMLEAPGTYHHSVIVGSMVEAAASEISANPLLAKVCGYYHDIGKIKKPLYFIENQADGQNRHRKLAPSMSSLILISHVKEGMEIARQYKLGQVIRDTIEQHHGTSLIRFFYEKAKQTRGEENVNIDDYRYPGPKPQTREAGLVMLADVVEASSRTLENPTPSRIQGHVQKQINHVFSDGQLDECELTLKDLHRIAKSFIKILSGIHHHRIEYPENTAFTGNGRDKSRKNGRTDREQAKTPALVDPRRPANGAGHLRRLGQS